MLFPATRRACNKYCTQSELEAGPVVTRVRQCGGLVAAVDVRVADAGTSLMWHGKFFGWFQRLMLVFLCSVLQNMDGTGLRHIPDLEQRTAEWHVTHPMWHVTSRRLRSGHLCATLAGYRSDMCRGRREAKARSGKYLEDVTTSHDGVL